MQQRFTRKFTLCLSILFLGVLGNTGYARAPKIISCMKDLIGRRSESFPASGSKGVAVVAVDEIVVVVVCGADGMDSEIGCDNCSFF